MTAPHPKFALLFAIQCRHAYFADGVCRVLSLRPTAACAALLARHRLRFKAEPGGGTVYYTDTGNQALPDYREIESLAFYLDSSDPYLANYTGGLELAVPDAMPSVWAFEHLAANETGPDTGFAMPVRLALLPQRFSVTLSAPGAVSVQDAAGRDVLRMDARQRAIGVDLRGASDGRYRLLNAGKPELDFYLGSAPGSKVWGLVSIDPRATAGGPIAPDGAVVPRTYEIRLASRATLWRYTVIGPQQPEPDYASYRVHAVGSGAADAVGFRREPAPVNVNRRSAARFVSTRPLELAERPHWRFTLEAPTGEPGPARRIALPYAQADTLTCNVAGTPCSDIYVYL